MIIVYAGIVGSGKTLKAVNDAYSYMKKGFKIYSNQYIRGTLELPINWYDYRYDIDSLLIIDEAQLEYNCRDLNTKAKNEINKKILQYLTMCRHYGLDILFITQSLSRLDVQIRELATIIYRFKKTYKIPYFSFEEKRIKWLPILLSGRVFNDSVDLEHFMASSNPQDFGSKYFCFVNPKTLKMYDTRIIDSDYISKPLICDVLHTKTQWNGFLVS